MDKRHILSCIRKTVAHILRLKEKFLDDLVRLSSKGGIIYMKKNSSMKITSLDKFKSMRERQSRGGIGNSIHGDIKYNRRKNKVNTRKEIRERFE